MSDYPKPEAFDTERQELRAMNDLELVALHRGWDTETTAAVRQLLNTAFPVPNVDAPAPRGAPGDEDAARYRWVRAALLDERWADLPTGIWVIRPDFEKYVTEEGMNAAIDAARTAVASQTEDR